MEAERLQAEFGIELSFAPYLLDPTVPPEGKPRRPYTAPGDPPTPMEERAASLGIAFTRGRTHTSSSRLALEAAEFAALQGKALAFHRAMFHAYFEELADIGTVDTVVRVGESVGLDSGALRTALEDGTYGETVKAGLHESYEMGVSGVPTFVFDNRYGLVGAQEYSVLESIIRRLDSMAAET